jgi:hypothetical protein
MLAQDALNESGRRGLPVGSSYVNNPVRPLWVSKQLNRSSGWFEPWTNFVFRNAKK